MNEPDSQLIIGIRNGDYISYKTLFTRYYNPLCYYVHSIVDNRDDSEDIIQNLFIKFWTNRHKIEIQNNVRIYLYKTARNMALNYLRDENVYKTALAEMQSTSGCLDDSELEYEEFNSILADCIDHLPPRGKEILLMHRLDGLKQKDISEKLEISVNTIKNHMRVALQRLKSCLQLKEVYFF